MILEWSKISENLLKIHLNIELVQYPDVLAMAKHIPTGEPFLGTRRKSVYQF